MASNDSEPLFMYSTTVSDVGTVRSNNQDSSFAGEHLVAVCDGMGGHAGGDTASTIAVRSLAHIETAGSDGNVEHAAQIMETSVMAAHDAIVGKAKRERKLAGMGTTITAMSLVSGYWVIAHIGDSRAYLLRDGKLQRLTTDHSYVQHLIDTKRISEAEARNHPQRNVVMRVLGDFDIDAHPDIAIRKAKAGDRLLLCSDGLCGVLGMEMIEEAMQRFSNPEECAQKLVGMALKAGSTDNVTTVIADATLALNANGFDLPHQTPLIGGAASSNMAAIADIVNEPVASAPALVAAKTSPAARAAALAQSKPAPPLPPDGANTQQVVQPSEVREKNGERPDLDTGEIPVVKKNDGRLSADPNDPEVANAIHHEQLEERKAVRTRKFRNRVIGTVVALVLVAAACVGAWAAYAWSQTQYYLGNSDGVVAIYQGVPTNIFGVKLSHTVKETDIKTAELPEQWQDRLSTGITFDTYQEAENHVDLIRLQWQELQDSKKQDDKDKDKDKKDASASSSASASPSASATASSSSSTSRSS